MPFNTRSRRRGLSQAVHPLFPAKPIVNFEVGALQNFKLHFDGDGWAEGVRDTAVRPHIDLDGQGVVRNHKCERLPLVRVYCNAIFLPNGAIKSAWGMIKKYLKREFSPYIGENSPVLVHLGKEAARWLEAPERGLLIYEPDYERFSLPRPTVAGDYMPVIVARTVAPTPLTHRVYSCRPDCALQVDEWGGEGGFEPGPGRGPRLFHRFKGANR